jgi:voltage-gated potassium channel
MRSPPPEALQSTETLRELRPYQLFMFALGIYVLVALAIQTFLTLDPDTDELLDQVDRFICVIFFVDFLFNLVSAPNRWAYLKWGWIDLLSCLPMVDFARAGRLARVIRVFRAFRGVRAARFVTYYLVNRRRDGAFFGVTLLGLLLVLFSSLAILQFETAQESNIKNPQDALWWAFTTITNVGYGDKYPVTNEGRLVAAALMTAGVGLFGSCTGLIASWLLVPTRKDREQDLDLAKLHVQVAQIQEHLHQTIPAPRSGTADPDLLRLQIAWPHLSADTRKRILKELAAEKSA